jgi:hypothetical protein
VKNPRNNASIIGNRVVDDCIEQIRKLEQQLCVLAPNSAAHKRVAREISSAAGLYRRSLDAAQAAKMPDPMR